MTDLTNSTLDELLDALAKRRPVPGGGAVAACAGALAGALGRMVSAYSIGPKTAEPIRLQCTRLSEQLRVMDELMRALITRDAESYLAMTEAYRLSKGDPAAADAYQEAVLAAVGVPMEIAAVAGRMLSSLDDTKEALSRYMVSDLGVTAVLACAAARAAGYMVRTNVSEIDNPSSRSKILGDIAALMDRCTAHRGSIESFVSARLEPSP